jgi:glycosyltransferase involved in cell wall biosynthesis
LIVSKEENKRILILIPGKDARGGIPVYYSALAPHFKLPVDFMERGARNWPERGNLFYELKRILRDYSRFVRAVNSGKYSLVLTNTSFSSLSIVRDGIYLIIARFYKLKTIVFFRGWDYDFAEKLKKKYFKIFKNVYFKSDAIIDLARKNIILLKNWGYTKQIYLETAVVDKNILERISRNQIENKYLKNGFNLLFLARIERTKGIYEALDTFFILKKKFPNLRMIVAGEGSEYHNVKKNIKKLKINKITFTGHIEGKQKADIFSSSDIYLFPSYNEGMPSSLAEAMAFGLPVVTRNVGGISDFFVNGEYGYITDSKDPVILASLVELLIVNNKKTQSIALSNYNFAKELFYSDKVVVRIENILTNVLNV